MRKKLSLDRSITELIRKLKEHIGSNGNAHLPVSTDMAGFMTPEILKEHDSFFKSRKDIYSAGGTDILKLPAGFYAGSNTINHPRNPGQINGSYAYINVIPSSQTTRRLIVLVEAATGAIWTRTVNDTYDVNNKWSKVEQAEVLWEGNSKMTKPVTLASSILDSNGNPTYSGIYVDYQTDTNNQNRQYGSRYGVVINTTNENNTLDVMAPVFYEGQLEFPTSNTAQMTRNRATVINSDSSGKTFLADATAAGSINILRISGLR